MKCSFNISSEISSKNSIASRKGTKNETSFVDELKKFFVATSQQTSINEDNDSMSSLNENHIDYARENLKPVIPLWKKHLLEEKTNRMNNKKTFINPEVGAMVISKPEWMNELKLKK